MNKYSRAFGRFALTRVAVAALSLASLQAWGLGLGSSKVQSALGETLKAEIDVSSMTADEAGSLKVRIATPDVYRASGVEFNAVLTSTQVQLLRRPDGRPYLRITSDRAVQEPFVDLILELNWSTGRLTREYTLLFDPPALARPAPPSEVTTAPVIAAAPAESRPVASQPTQRPAAQRPAVPAPASAQRAEPKPAPAPAPVNPTAASDYAVKPGDTLSRIANKTQVDGISLDQMLVGLYRANPDAFVDNNMNRLKAGVVLKVPGSDKLGELSPAEARQVIQAQSADFNSYRQRLASGAPLIHQDESDKSAKGRVQAEVADKKPAAAAAPDKLTLSKPSASVGSEVKASKDTEKKDSAARVAELTRNVEELKKLSSQTKPAAAPAAAPTPAPAPAPAPAVTLPAALPAPASVPSPAASAAAPAPAVSEVASAASRPKPAASRPKPAPAPAPEPSFIDSLTDGPILPILAGVLVVALGGLGLMRLRNRRPEFKAETAFTESRLQPDSFFGASGGQRIDTRESGNSSQSSMSYSLSQLDAIGDVDPVAEADVYLAYGRDLQAEEILKEALRANPERLAIRLKLLEVYAKRRDTKAYEQLASQLYAETQGQGEDWPKVQELGRQIDPEHPLYQPGGMPAALAAGDAEQRPEPMNATTLPASAGMLGTPATDPGPASSLDLDLDLDLGGSSSSMQATQALPVSAAQAPLRMDVDLGAPKLPESAQAAAADLEFDLNELGDFDAATAAAPLPPDAQSLDFDLSSIDLDLPATDAPAPTATVVDPHGLEASGRGAADQLADAIDALADDDGDPLQRQLELAEEFRQIGDVEGARDVLQELVMKAEGNLRAKAQAMLDELR